MQAGELFTSSKLQSVFLISMQLTNKCRAGLVVSIFGPAQLLGLRCSILTMLSKEWLLGRLSLEPTQGRH